MAEQNFSNHRRFVSGYHFVLSMLLLAGICGAIVNVCRHLNFEGLLSCLLILLMFVCLGLLAWFTRTFPLRSQDRAIRAEENLRHYVLTNNRLSENLSIAQITALRFASDEEFPSLADRAVTENLSADDIKKAIKNWRADHHRV